MAEIKTKKYSQGLYIPWLQELIDFGNSVDVRGRKTQEFLDCISVVTEPWHHCILIPSRRWNPWLAMSEALWILAGRNDVEALKPYNSHIGDYSDDGITLYGAYGARIYDQIDDLIGRLRKDPFDRRAVLQIWDNSGPDTCEGGPADNWEDYHEDLTANTKDPPCNNMVYFKLRDNKLHMTVICRSNDIHFGLFAVNLPTFGILQEYIAARLGVEIGYQTHLSNSLHVYTDDKRAVEITNRMLYNEPEDVLAYPSHERVFNDISMYKQLKHEGFAGMCSAALIDVPLGSGADDIVPFLGYARIFLRAYREKDLSIIPDDERYSDWLLAAKIFADRVWNNR